VGGNKPGQVRIHFG